MPLEVGRVNTRLQILESASNARFQGHLLRLLEACENVNLLVWSDEDDLSAAAVRAAQQASKSRFVACAPRQFLIGERMYRGRRCRWTVRPSESDAAASIFRTHRIR